MTETSQPRTATLKVFAVADRGMAMAHLDGRVAFVPLAAPGDVVEVEVVRERKRYVETRLLRILAPSPLRRPPACPHFGTCGGCQWQHLAYTDQIAAKARSFQGFLKGRLGIRGDDLFRPVIPSPEEWGYRNRVGLKVRAAGDRVKMGYFARGSHRLIPIRRCPIAHPAIQGLLPDLESFLQTFSPARGGLPQVDLQVDGTATLWAVFHFLRKPHPADVEALREFSDREAMAGACVQAGRKHTLTTLPETPAEMPFRVLAGDREIALGVTPGGFNQANPAVNQALVDEVVALGHLYEGRTALDLYCGAGNFTLPLALRAAAVVGVEGYPPAARDATENARTNGFDNVRVLPAPADQGLRALAAEGFRPSFALLDPPREGAAEALDGLAELAPDHILYISCAPPTLARDLNVLRAKGYQIQWVRAADMFPQTAHLESITLLERAG